MTTELWHYGIKGQKKGIRRFQNEDGSYTEEGKERYGIGEGRDIRDSKLDKSSDHVKSKTNISSSFIQVAKRAFQRDKKEDLPYYNSVQKEKQQNKTLSKRRIQLQEQYLQKGFTKEQSEVKAYKREKLETALKIVGGIAITAALAYGTYKGHKLIQRYSDKIVRKGASIQRVTDNPNDVLLNRPGFVTSSKSDFSKYRGMYGHQVTQSLDDKRFANKMLRMGGKPTTPIADSAYAVNAKAVSRLKIAGERTGNKVFNNLMKNDPEFRKNFHAVSDKKTPIPLRWGSHVSDYEKFNVGLAGLHNKPENIYMRDKFYNALKRKGYDGVLDLNDRRFSGYRSKGSSIIFDLKNKLNPINATKLDSSIIKNETYKGATIINKQSINEKRIKKLFSGIGKISLGSLGIGSIGLAGKATTSVSDNKNAKRYRMIINAYREEHPNTKLSDQKILENELGI